MQKKIVNFKDKDTKMNLKSEIGFKTWDEIKIEDGFNIFSYFYTLMAIIYSSYSYKDRGLSKPEILSDIPVSSISDFMIAFFELPEKEFKTNILINTWALTREDKTIVDLISNLATKNGKGFTHSSLAPEEFNTMIDFFAELLLGVKDKLNFTQL